MIDVSGPEEVGVEVVATETGVFVDGDGDDAIVVSFVSKEFEAVDRPVTDGMLS